LRTVGEALVRAHQAAAAHSETPALDAQVLVAEILGRSRAWVLAHGEEEIATVEASAIQGALLRCREGEPLPYIIGWWEFFGRRFRVSSATLIPRPETESLVELALETLRGVIREKRAADIGTGSGCIAVTLAAEIEAVRVVATDTSGAALRIAKMNAVDHEVEARVFFVRCDLLKGLEGGYDVVCGNLPYIPTGELVRLPVSRWEPRLALDGGIDGLQFLRRLLTDLPRKLNAGGIALLEIGESQSDLAAALARQSLPGWGIQVQKDLAGRPRVLRIGQGR